MSSCAESMCDYEAEEAAAAFAEADWLEGHEAYEITEAYGIWQAAQQQEQARADEEVAMAIDSSAHEGAEAAEAPAANPQTSLSCAYEEWQAQEEEEHARAALEEQVAMAIDHEGAEAAEAPAANPQTPAQEHPQTPPQERF
ncbi:hypothetical protein DIPPA_22016 [Diplonema papillatum]|nr:hypothetical protein DIPPA_22022 [Diplonema papillatum]KAJ9447823.1 hypothetical protein DIPPA_22016 [Diplonema papillatum]